MPRDRQNHRNDNAGLDADLIQHLGNALRNSLVESILTKQPSIARKDAVLIKNTIGSALRPFYGEPAREPLPNNLKRLLDELAAKEWRRGVPETEWKTGALAEVLAKERVQDDWMIQGELGKAIHQSTQRVLRDPLPNEMALLLLRLAAAQTIKLGDNEGVNGRLSATTDEPETRLARATRHVARAQAIAARQRERVVQLQAERRATEDAMRLLDVFVQTLATMEDHLRLMRNEAERKDKTSEWLFSRIAARIAVAPPNVPSAA